MTDKLRLLTLFGKFRSEKAYKGFTDKQKSFFESLFSGENVFLTGPGGVGKSYCLSTLFEFLERERFFVGKTASTGIAAVNISGSTIHSFAGLGLADKDGRALLNDVKKNKKAIRRISGCRMLFIDEISMIDSDLLDKLDLVFREFRQSGKPFGGVQVCFSGDFLQLPPVAKGFFDKSQAFCFNSDAWKGADIKAVYLDEIIRQDKTSEFAALLNEIRQGDLTNVALLDKCVHKKNKKSKVDPVRLFCINKNVDVYNHEKLKSIDSESRFYYADDTGDPRHIEFLNKNCLAPKTLELKIGAQVILLYNLNTELGFVNGTVGVIKSFENGLPVLERTDGETIIVEKQSWDIKEAVAVGDRTDYNVVASRKQIPLKLGWAATVHKSQGMTLDTAEVDLDRAFEYGQVYVALSRVKSMDGLILKNFDPSLIKAHPSALKFYKELSNKTTVCQKEQNHELNNIL